jgi:Ca2+-binding RTX toxin-like protein
VKRTCCAAVLCLISAAAPGAVTATFNNATGQLDITSNAADNIAVTVSAGLVKVNGANPGGALVTPASVAGIAVVGSASANNINLSAVSSTDFASLTTVSIDGGNGNDTIIGSQFADTITNGGGDDEVDPQGGDDRVNWTYQSDLLVLDSTGDDTVSLQAGGGDDDIVTSTSGAIGQTQLSDTLNSRFAFIPSGETIIISMGAGNDRFRAGASTPDTALLIVNGDGDSDTIDLSMGGATLNELRGGAGDDQIIGSRDADSIFGGSGDDLIEGRNGNDIIDAGADSDTVTWTAGEGTDTVEGGTGFDTFVYNDNNNSNEIDLSSTGTAALLRPGDHILTGVESAIILAEGGNDFLTQESLVGSGLTTVVFDGGTGTNQTEFFGSAGFGPGDSYLIGASVGGALSTQIAGTTTEASNISGTYYYGTARADSYQFSNLAGVPAINVLVDAGGGDDTIDMSAVSAAAGIFGTIYGGGGADEILGSGSADIISGGDGNDSIDGGPGVDDMEGDSSAAPAETGDDTFVWNLGDETDILDGGPGDDTAIVNGSDNAAIAESYELGFEAGLSLPRIARFAPVPFAVVLGSIESLELNGNAGNDSLTLMPLDPGVGPASLVFRGGDGDDFFGADSSPAGALASITFEGGNNTDTAEGAFAVPGTYLLGPGSDFFYGSGAADTVLGEGGDDTAYFAENTSGAEFVGGPGTNDFCALRGAANSVLGDHITAAPDGAGVAISSTGSGVWTNRVESAEVVEISGDQGDDIIDMSGAPAGISFVLNGNGGTNTLIGSPSADTLIGGAENDFIRGGPGDDTISPFWGSNDVEWRAGDGSDFIEDDFEGTTSLTVHGTGGDDAIVLGGTTALRANALAQGNAGGTFAITGMATYVSVFGGDGADTLSAVEFQAATGVLGASLDGGDGADTIDANGSSFRVNILGGPGIDRISGSPFDDSIEGEAGADIIAAGPGDDNVDGGPGDDTIRWNDGDGDDDIFGGTGTRDILEVSNASANIGDVDFTLSADDDGSGTLTRVPRTAGPDEFALHFNDVEIVELTGTSGPDHLIVGDPSDNPEVSEVRFFALGGTDDMEIFGTTGSDSVVSDGTAILANGRRYQFGSGVEAVTFRCDEGNDDVTAKTAAQTTQTFIAGPGANDSFHFDAGGLAFGQSGSGTITFTQAGRADVIAQGFESVDEATDQDVWMIQ